MELHIQDLVDSIKRDGVQEAQRQAAQIISEATMKAEQIVRDGEREAAKIVEQGRKEASLLRHSGEAAVQQAGRDVLLSLESAIKKQFDRLLSKQIQSALSQDALVSLIIQIVKSNIVKPDMSSVELKKADFDALSESLKKQLVQEMKDGLVIRPVEDVSFGFRLSEKDGSGYFDFSADELVAMMKPFLNASVQNMISTVSAE
ncbi:MAG: V-type ATP synthase subunit E [Sphaerochaetaceae bacterium]|jgi:V/A-type H+-transporting ATPase subunit E|nr:V-type ATP synthase subunit E [Sphaerochaetaceae bacterium]NLV84574.1 V-type ATP synthase subunit E [Spirochaetales bacterium]